MEEIRRIASVEVPVVSNLVTALPGQETLLACWSTLTKLSPGARLLNAAVHVAAVFPAWGPLNNAIMLTTSAGAAAAASSRLAELYADAGVDIWGVVVAESDDRPRHAR